jgi:molybdopterin/thiamine biosynthesis adenylyltransferase
MKCMISNKSGLARGSSFNMSQAEDRYGTLRLIDWFSLERVQSARVMVVGAGAIGNEVLKNLALLGIGHILIVDPDLIETTNLSRSILFRESDVGGAKARVAAAAINAINPMVKVTPFVGRIQDVFGLGAWRRVDAVIGCLDNRVARYFVNRMSQAAGAPWVNAGIGALDGQVQVFRPGRGACYECLFTASNYEEIRISCGVRDRQMVEERRVPTTPTIASLVAAIQVQEFLKLLDSGNWEGRTLVGREFRFRGTQGDAEVMNLPRRDDCPAHDHLERESIVELPNCGAASTSAREILRMGRDQLGSEVVIQLGFELAVEKRCRFCNDVTRLLKPRNSMMVSDSLCQSCGLLSLVTTTHHLGKPTSDYDEDFLDLSLKELGVPPLEIIHILGSDGRDIHFELSGDVPEILDQNLI